MTVTRAGRAPREHGLKDTLKPRRREGRLFVLLSQAEEVMRDLRLGLARKGSPELGIPSAGGLRFGDGDQLPGHWTGPALREISSRAAKLEGNILIIKVGNLRSGDEGLAHLGNDRTDWSRSRLASGQETEAVGRTFFSPEIAARDSERRLARDPSETSQIPGLTISLYQCAEAGQLLGLSDREVASPADAEAETSVTIWHELLLHAVPANTGDPRHLHQSGDLDNPIPAEMVVAEAREAAIEKAIRRNAEANLRHLSV